VDAGNGAVPQGKLQDILGDRDNVRTRRQVQGEVDRPRDVQEVAAHEIGKQNLIEGKRGFIFRYNLPFLS